MNIAYIFVITYELLDLIDSYEQRIQQLKSEFLKPTESNGYCFFLNGAGDYSDRVVLPERRKHEAESLISALKLTIFPDPVFQSSKTFRSSL